MKNSPFTIVSVVLLLGFNISTLFGKISTNPPVAICQNFNIQLDVMGIATILPSDIDNGSSGCTALTLSLDVSSFTCADIGANPVILTVTDNNGLSSSCSATVTVNDNTDPTALCKDATLALDANGQAVLTVADIDNGSTDACGISQMVLSKTMFNCSNVGTNSVNLTIADNNGNLTSCQATVTVVDNLDPIPNCISGPLIVNLDASGAGTITTTDIENGSTDNCGIASMSLDKTSFTCADIGPNNTVTLTVTDVNGNTANCTTMVTVMDQISPVAMCKDTTLILSIGGIASLTAAEMDDGSTDNCSTPTFTLAQTNFDCNDIGSNTIVFTATDADGNANTCTSTVTIVDQTAPVPVCQNAIVALDSTGFASITFTDIDNGTLDECTLDTLLLDKQNFNCLDVGSNTVTMTAIDASGNSATCTATVTVQDNIVPIANCFSSVAVQLDQSGQASISVLDINNNSFDNCPLSTMTLSQTNYSCLDIGSSTVTLTISDDAGNNANCTTVVNVADNFPPIATCSNHILYLDASGNGSILPTDIDNISPNACSFQSMSLTTTAFDCTDLGTNQVVLTVNANNGSSSTCNALVNVRDTISPIAISQDLIVFLDATGSATITSAQIDNGSNDACGISSFTISESNFDCTEVGVDTIVLTVIDNSGNMDTASALIVVQDTVPPTVFCQNISLTLGAGGAVSVSPSDIDNGSSDACGISSMTLDKNNFQCSDLGINTVTLTVTDNSGNSSSCTATVTIIDNIIPVSTCTNATLELDANGNGMLLPSNLDGGSYGSCTGFNLSLSQSTFDCSDIGTNFIVLTTTNTTIGSSATCISIVDVLDNTPPTVNCQNITVPLNGVGLASISVSQVDNGSSDNCGIASMTIDQTNFDCSHIGDNMVKLKVTDVNGNADSCFATVTIEDQRNPIAICNNTSVILDANGNASVTPAAIGNSSTDNCGINLMTLDINTFNASNAGTNMVTLQVEDFSGNTDVCNATVTVINPNQASAICQNINVQLDNNGNATISASDIDNGSSVATGTPILSISTSSFDCNDVGTQTVVLTVSDANGNSSSCTSTVIVLASAACNTGGGGNPPMVFVGSGPTKPLPNVMVDINGVEQLTNNQGMASFSNIPTATSYTITPMKDTNPANGITTFDLVLIQGYILQTINLSPRQVIAADANRNGVVTAFDLVQLRSLILFIITDLPNNTSWRFVESSFVFPPPNAPNVPSFPESVTITTSPQGIISFDAIKVGDVNESASFTPFTDTNGRSGKNPLVFETTDKFVNPGDEVNVSFKCTSREAIAALQFTLDFDPEALVFQSNHHGKFEKENLFFNKQFVSEGILTAGYYNTESVFLNDEVLFSLNFIANKKGKLSELIDVNSSLTKAKAFDSNGNPYGLELTFIETNQNKINNGLLVSNVPNPFEDQTSIEIILDRDQEIDIEIFTAKGELIKVFHESCKTGKNQIHLNKSHLNNSGVYYYRVSNGIQTVTNKMLLIN